MKTPGAPPIIPQTYEVVATVSLKSHPRNPNRGDLGRIYESVEENGFYGAVVVQKSTGTILAGHHRWMAAQKAGMPELPVIYVDCNDRQALKILLVDNRTTRLGSDDPNELVKLLEELARDGDLVGTGFDGDDLDELIADLAGLGDAVQGEDAQPTSAITCPSCGHTFLHPERKTDG